MSEADILKIICNNGGAIEHERLLELASGFPDICSKFDSLIGNKELFFSTEINAVKQILAKTNVRICKVTECTNCTNLHLCKFYLHGECKARRCRFGHDLNSEHNAKVLSDHHLQKLSRAEIRQLFLQNDSPHSLLPPVCAGYNRGNGDFGQCDDKDNCNRLHICEDYIRGTCDSGDCGRSHDFFEPHPMKTLQGRGVPGGLVGSMLSVYQRILVLRGTLAKDAKPEAGTRTRGRRGKGRSKGDAAATNNTTVTKDESRPAKPEINEICLFFIRTDCKQGNRCWRVHSKMPYQWQMKSGETWTDLPNSEDLERDFCNPINTTALSGSDSVCFDTMTCGPHEMRRLSTASSVLQPDFILTTEWLWYWEDEYGKWILYGSIKEMHRMSTISSSDLEKRYQEDSKAVVLFTAGKEHYELSFKDMMQKNVNYGTPRRVRRRPKFVSSDGVQVARTSKRRGPASSHYGRGVPGYWDKSAVPETGYKRVTLLDTDRDYLKVQELFTKTLSGYDIVSVERIQNKELWEDFQTKRERMKKANIDKKFGDGERLLFHGTNSEYIDAICYQNFDWRKCGANGTVYGQGCYFARDARYSHDYTSGYGTRSMFVCRVLVGCYTRGQSNYRLPPSRDGGHILYDSCVNDGRDPSIFVVFDKQQVYPEFLITYTEHVYRSPVTVIDSDDSDDSDYLLSPFKTTYTQLDSTQNSAVLTTKASAPQTVSVSSLTSSSSVSPSPMVPSSSRGLPSSSGTVSVQLPSSLSLAPAVAAPSPPSVSIPTSSVSKPSSYTPSSKASDPNPAQAVSAARTTALSSPSQSSASSSKQPSDPLQTAQSKSVSYSDDFGWDFIDIQSPPRRSLYSSSDASLTSSGVRSATQTSASTRRVSPPLLTTTKPSYSRPMTRPRRQEDLYYVPSTARSTYEPKKKEECILL